MPAALSSATAEEKEIHQVKYKSQRFGSMQPADREKAAYALLLKIHVITGWVLPTDDGLLNILVDQFEKKLSETYANVNADEVEYAFRNMSGVKDWGKNMNLSLIDEVMIPYLEKRFEVSRLEEEKKKPVMIENKTLEDISMMDWLNATKKKVQEGNCPVEFIPEMLYDFAVKAGLITPTNREKNKMLQCAVERRQAMLYGLINDRDGAKDFHRFMAMKSANEWDDTEFKRLLSLSKKMILWDYLKQ